MTIRVFISHAGTDSPLATRVAAQVRSNGLETYLDVIDDALMKDGPQLADHLLARMDRCQQLIAVVSTDTKESWWVPWEIGAGAEKGFRMATFSQQYVYLPSYLTKWPNLRSDGDIASYCRLSQEVADEVTRRERMTVNLAERVEIRKNQASNFHTRLKVRLGQ